MKSKQQSDDELVQKMTKLSITQKPKKRVRFKADEQLREVHQFNKKLPVSIKTEKQHTELLKKLDIQIEKLNMRILDLKKMLRSSKMFDKQHGMSKTKKFDNLILGDQIESELDKANATRRTLKKYHKQISTK